MKKLISKILVFASAAVAARSLPDHPVLEKILARYESEPIAQTCRNFTSREFSTIAARERFESALVLKDLKSGGCKLDFLAVGGRDYVNRDLELYEKLLRDPRAESAIDLHVHPLMNVDYFREGNPYKGEIMFATAEAINEARLPGALFDALILRIEQGTLPSFNLSPPSMPDLLFTAGGERNPLPISYQVVTAGGIWSYVGPSKENAEAARRNLDNLNVYAFMYEVAHSTNPDVTPARKERARRLFEENMKDPGNRRRFLEAQSCSLGLRRPYSRSSVVALLDGDRTAVLAEFQEKLALASRWSLLMKELGFEMTFKPFDATR